MRTYTILFSIVAHSLLACAVVVRTVIATDALPEPRRASEFLIVKPALPAEPPPAPRVQRRDQAPPSPDAAPLEAQNGVLPETSPRTIADVPSPLDGALVAGIGSVPVASVEPPPPPPSPPVAGPVRVGGAISAPMRTHDVRPIYPPIAQSARVSGVVILEAVIGEDGNVRDLKVLRSIPLLDQAAVDAVRQWRFTPTLLNGQPVPVVMTVTVAFNLH